MHRLYLLTIPECSYTFPGRPLNLSVSLGVGTTAHSFFFSAGLSGHEDWQMNTQLQAVIEQALSDAIVTGASGHVITKEKRAR
jgi:hypothetical protein